MKKYNELTTKEKNAMFLPKGTILKRIGNSGTLSRGTNYILSSAKLINERNVILEDNSAIYEIEYFDIISIPEEIPEIINNYSIY